MPLTVQVVTPEREVTVSDDATLLIAHGTEGDVGVMPGHAPLLVALGIGPLTIVHADGRREAIAIDGGFLQVHDDKAIVLAEYAAVPSETDPEALRREIEELRQRIMAEAENQQIREQLARAEVLQGLIRAH